MNRRTLTLAAVAAAALLATGAHAQAWPAKPVKIVVPYAPGGAVDVVTRKMAQKLTEQTGQSFVVENRPGGTGTIGALQVARADADGYTLMANDTTFSLIPHIFKKLPFDPTTDLVPVSAYVFAPMGLVVSSTSRYKTLGDMVADARANPTKVTYGTGGPGTTPHFATEALVFAELGRHLAPVGLLATAVAKRWHGDDAKAGLAMVGADEVRLLDGDGAAVVFDGKLVTRFRKQDQVLKTQSEGCATGLRDGLSWV